MSDRDQRAEVAELRAAGDDLAGLLLMVLDDTIRNRWVTEGSPVLDEPRRALERWRELGGEGGEDGSDAR
jgi:hypothetical protein